LCPVNQEMMHFCIQKYVFIMAYEHITSDGELRSIQF
jgi:hypothetical protein